MPFLPPNQQRQSTEGNNEIALLVLTRACSWLIVQQLAGVETLTERYKLQTIAEMQPANNNASNH